MTNERIKFEYYFLKNVAFWILTKLKSVARKTYDSFESELFMKL